MIILTLDEAETEKNNNADDHINSIVIVLLNEYMMFFTTLIVIIGLINAEKIGKDGPPTNCICRQNGTICSQPGCARGDNHNCNYFESGSIEYTIRKHRFNQISLYACACACPNYKGFHDGYANAHIFEFDYFVPHNYTTCDNIVTSNKDITMSADFTKNAVSCCYYCCTNFTVGGD